jgi:hypothetical protein
VYSPAPSDLNLDGAGKPLSFSSVICGPHGKEWTLADEQELIKLLVTLKCLLPVMRPTKTPTYLKRVVKEKWNEVHRVRKRRVRWTIGGDRIEVGYDVGTNTAALPTVNALFHSIVSTHSCMATIDIVDYYLGALLPSPESVRIDVSSISLPTLTKLGLLPFLRHSHGKPFFFCDVLKLSLVFPNLQSGLLSQLRLISLLTQHGFSETSTPMLFRHHTHSTAFTLVVDDFLVRYSHPSELDHLVSCLSTLDELKVHRDLPRYTYLGYTLDYSPTSPSPCMTLSMHNFIPSMLSHLCPSGCGSASSPAVYTPPVSYTDLSPHLSPSSITTPSTPVSPTEKTWIQQVVGSLLFYARALDLSLLTAVCQLSSHQSTPTQHDLSSAHRLLNCASSHPNPHKTIHLSSMALWAYLLHRRQLRVLT